MSDYSLRIQQWYPPLLVLITMAIFWQSVFMEFTFDDRLVVLGDPRIGQWDLGTIWTQDGQPVWSRQVRLITYMIDHSLFGFSPTGYHLHNLFWHVLCVVLVFILLKKLCQHPTLSFLGALVFAIHPIHVEAVTNITNRKELLALGFLLLAFLSYIAFLKRKTNRKWLWLLAGMLSWGLGLLSKQVTVVLPLLLVGYEYLLVPKDQRFLTKKTVLLIGLLGLGSLTLLLYAFLILDVSNLKASAFLAKGLKGYHGDLTYLSLVATSARAFWTYIGLLIWPAGLCPDHLVDLSTSLLEFRALLAWLGLIAFLILMYRTANRWPLLALGMLWFFVGYLAVSNWVPASFILADRYMYIPSVGYCIVLVTLAQASYQWLSTYNRPWAFGIMTFLGVALSIAYSSTTLAYNPHWNNQKSLFTYTLQCNPESVRAYSNLGDYYFQQGSYLKAGQNFSKAIALGGVDDYNNRGNLFYKMGEYEAALRDFTQIISLKPDWGKPYSNRGVVYYAQERYDRAVEDFTKALAISDTRSRIYNLRGLAYEKLGKLTLAKEDYNQAIASDPTNGEAFFNLGRIQIHDGEFNEAVLSYRKAKQLGWERAKAVLEVLRTKGYLER